MRTVSALLPALLLAGCAQAPVVVGDSADCLRDPVRSGELRDAVKTDEDARRIQEMEDMRRKGHASVGLPGDQVGSLCGERQGH